jgi:pimeloyl-ACP methyl ester carboxylesterase
VTIDYKVDGVLLCLYWNMMNFPYVHETKELTDTVRASAGGSFIHLSDGVCHYELSKPEDSQTIVLIHGFSVPSYIWDPTYDFLANSGLRVLRYDLFGRGFSDRPKAAYNINFFVRQLKELLDGLEIKKPIHLAGLSLGGPISAAFVDQYPERVQSHILIDPAGANPVQLSWVLKAVKLPLLPELILGLFGGENLVKSIASDFFTSDMIQQFQSKYRVQMRYKGFLRAILSTIRNGMLDSFHETYQRVGKLKKATLLFWGRNDTTVPFAESQEILSAIPHAEFHPVENCGHIPHYEKPGVVNPILLHFLSLS